MAELRDKLNRKVLHVQIVKHEGEKLLSNVRLVFQESLFVDNEIGWKDEIQAEVCWYNLPLIRTEVLSFIQAGRLWSDLPLSELAKTSFTGVWNLGKDYSTQRFEIEFKPLYHTPTKTDGFTVRVDINPNIWQEQEFATEYTSLVNVINDLQMSVL
jgi:hypothetical protein